MCILLDAGLAWRCDGQNNWRILTTLCVDFLFVLLRSMLVPTICWFRTSLGLRSSIIARNHHTCAITCKQASFYSVFESTAHKFYNCRLHRPTHFALLTKLKVNKYYTERFGTEGDYEQLHAGRWMSFSTLASECTATTSGCFILLDNEFKLEQCSLKKTTSTISILSVFLHHGR